MLVEHPLLRMWRLGNEVTLNRTAAFERFLGSQQTMKAI